MPSEAETDEPPTALAIGSDGLQLTLDHRRLSVMAAGKTVLDVSIGEVRRIQFDVERGRPATLVIVPDRPSNEPQILQVPKEQLDAAAAVLAKIGRGLEDATESGR